MEPQYILSIDLGTTGIKAALVGDGGEIAASTSRPVQTILVPPDGAEQDAQEIWDATKSAMQQVIRDASRPADEIIGVAVASQFSSVVAVDRSGHPVMNLILWMDGRGASCARDIYGRHPKAIATWIDVHGAMPLPSGNDSLSHMLWVKEERPDVYERTHKFLEPMDYLTARLTGEFTANACTAFMMVLTDNRQLDNVRYDETLIEMSGMDRDKLPDLVPVLSPVGAIRPDVAEEVGLPRGVRVLSGLNDTQAVAVGAGTFRAGNGGVNIGTTSQVLVHVAHKASDLEHSIVSSPSPIRGSYVAIAENGIGAKALDHFLTNVIFASDALGDHRADDIFGRVDSVVKDSPPGSGSLLFLPWLAGAQAPSSNPNARGGFLNLSLNTTRADMVRSILEGVAYNLRWLLPAVEKFAGNEFEQLHFSGGAALSDEWSQILADVMDRPLLQLEEPRHIITRATAFLAFERLGLVEMSDFPKICRVKRSYEPQPERRQTYDDLFEQFLVAFDRNRPIFDSLNA
ncbi:MAG: FGGY-family carbohydrate kinase [Chloroflexi bacterium]|nr:FGGY-family carbohydrate kinase [Chloroflexota bacterium]